MIIIRPVADQEVPKHLTARFAQEETEAKRVREEKEEQLNYITVAVQTERYHTFDLLSLSFK